MNRYTGELWHHGIQGQKWGVRRYQNSDGTLTELGRKHYGYGPPREKREKVAGVGSTAKNLGHRVKEGVKRGVMGKLAEKMPFMFTDEELAAHEDRMRKENSFRQGVANKKNLKKSMKGENFLKNLLESSVKTATNNVVNEVTRKAANRLAETNAEKRVRQAKETQAIDDATRKMEQNALNRAVDQNKQNIEEGIDEINRNTQEIRSNQTKSRDIDKKIREYQSERANAAAIALRASHDDTPDSYVNRYVAEQTVNYYDNMINNLKKEQSALSSRNNQLTQRNADIDSDNSALRANLKKWASNGGGGGGGVSKDDMTNIINKILDERGL